jgi:hypothetical protein
MEAVPEPFAKAPFAPVMLISPSPIRRRRQSEPNATCVFRQHKVAQRFGVNSLAICARTTIKTRTRSPERNSGCPAGKPGNPETVGKRYQ